jgi:hypothetical protein
MSASTDGHAWQCLASDMAIEGFGPLLWPRRRSFELAAGFVSMRRTCRPVCRLLYGEGRCPEHEAKLTTALPVAGAGVS